MADRSCVVALCLAIRPIAVGISPCSQIPTIGPEKQPYRLAFAWRSREETGRCGARPTPVSTELLDSAPSKRTRVGFSFSRSMVRAASSATADTPCEANLLEGSLFQAEKNAQNAQSLALPCGNMNCPVLGSRMGLRGARPACPERSRRGECIPDGFTGCGLGIPDGLAGRGLCAPDGLAGRSLRLPCLPC